MPVCSVITCKFSAGESNPIPEGIVFHPFPNNEETRAKWVDMTGLDDWTPTSKDYICSRHFRDNDYFIKRSGKRYLKTAAIPCEYVVYRHLFPDEEVAEEKHEPKVVVMHEEEQKYDMQLENQPGTSFHNLQSPGTSRYGMQLAGSENPEPSSYGMQVAPVEQGPIKYNVQVVEPLPGPSRGFAPGTSRQNAQLPDSTIASIFDTENMRDWDRIRPEHYFGSRPPVSLFEDSSQEVDSSGFDEHFGRDVEASINPYPPGELDLRPHLQQLPLPRTPEPVVAENILEPVRGPGIEEIMDIPISSVIAEIMRGRQQLQDVRKIMTRRKSSKKEEEEPRASRRRPRDAANPAKAAARAEVLEAQKAKFEMQSREMTDQERASAIITLQTKNILKLNMQHRKLKKIVKRISAVLRRPE